MITPQDRPPLDESGRGHLRGTIAHYSVATALCLLAEVVLFHLWEADLRVPFYYDVIGSDLLGNLACAKNMVETGSFLVFPRLGTPGTLDVHDFQTLDNIHFLIFRAIASVAREPGVALNVFYLLSFLLITWTSLYVMKRLGISGPVAVVASLLYAFAPYHFMRGPWHLFLGAYYAIPPLALLLLRLCEGRPLFVAWEAQERRWVVRGFSLITCVLVAGSGIYLAFFGLYFIAVASLIGFSRSWRGVRLLDGAIAFCLVFGLLIAQAIPKFQYDRDHGKNPIALRRDPDHSLLLALSISKMLMPTPYHKFKGLVRGAMGRSTADTATVTDFTDENQFVALGVFASCGFLALLAVPFLVRLPPGLSALLYPLAKLGLAGVLLGVPGGIGYLIALYVTPNIRAYNRVSIYIAYFSVLGAALLLEHLRRSIGSPRRRLSFDVALGGLLVAGLFDQMPRNLVPDPKGAAARYSSEHDYFGRIEASLPAGSMVFQLPYARFPEEFSSARKSTRISFVGGGYNCQEHFRPFFHTDQLRWSSPAMKGREVDLWQAKLWAESPDRIVAELTRAGFRGISIDRDGYDDRADGLIAELRRGLGSEPVESPDHRYAFFMLAAANPSALAAPATSRDVSAASPPSGASPRRDSGTPN